MYLEIGLFVRCVIPSLSHIVKLLPSAISFFTFLLACPSVWYVYSFTLPFFGFSSLIIQVIDDGNTQPSTFQSKRMVQQTSKTAVTITVEVKGKSKSNNLIKIVDQDLDNASYNRSTSLSSYK